ncbi:MAG: hypothetical protein ABIZ81_11050 [Opitutaceae bacterium]
MKFPTFVSLLVVSAGLALPRLAAAASVERPLIWVTPADRAALLAKIESQPWARASFENLKEEVRGAVAEHQKDPAAYLRKIPTIPSPAGTGHPPTFAPIAGNMASTPDKGAGPKLERLLTLGVHCGALYYLTQDEAYAKCAADILHVFVEAIIQMKTDLNDDNGGLLYPNDFLYEARGVGDQIPLIYDFVQPWLKRGGAVLDLVSGQPVAFNFAHAQELFRAYARFAIDGGIIDNNHPVLEMSCLAHCALALDDATERADTFAYLVSKDTPHQDSLAKVLKIYAAPGSVWPESFQYSSSVSARLTYLVALVRRQKSASQLPASFVNIPLSLVRLADFRFPNGENIRFGDGPRRGGGGGAQSLEIAYAMAQRDGDATLRQEFGSVLARNLVQGKYDRTESARDALPLLWYAPEIVADPAAPARLRTTDELPFVGAVLQRNLSPDKNPVHAFMAVVSGGAHVHSHATGMTLELYGAGHVLGTAAGKGTYTTDEHENYRRLFAAANSVIVNGTSRSSGGWVNLGIDTVRPVALEPAVGAAPVSPNYSFTLTRFADQQLGGTTAPQERLVGLVRTSASTGYYVDVFRSHTDQPSQFHDYLWHNLGDQAVITAGEGKLKLSAAPDRFVPAAGTAWKRNQTYLYPGWHFFKQAQASAPFAGDVTVDFTAGKLAGGPAHMRLHIPGQPGREYAQALALETKEAPVPYDHAPTPVLVVRQQGEAWARPFAVVFEPFAGSEKSARIQSATALTGPAGFAGFKVISKINGATLTQYVLVQPEPASVWQDAALGVTFTGRYAVVTLNERDECTALYLGEGSSLTYRGTKLRSVSGAPTAASAEINGPAATVTAGSPAELTLSNGQQHRSAPPL